MATPRTPAPPRARSRRRERGATLLVATVALAVLTALAVELAYETRVAVQVAANGRDELRAVYAAKGAVNLSRLVLKFQQQLDGMSVGAGAGGQGVGVRSDSATTAGLAQLGQAAPLIQAALASGGLGAGMPRIQVWKAVPVGNLLATALFPDDARPGSAPPPSFEAKLEDEASKVNAQLDGSATGGLLAGQLAAFLDLVGDHRWDFLFDREDANGIKITRNDLAIYLYDWVDQNKVTSGLTGNPDRPFEDAFGDENWYYDRGPDRYRTKNARFDSLDELYLVAGVSDAFMAAFRDQLTVYVRTDGKFTLSCDDPKSELRAARIMADVPNQPALLDPTFPDKLTKAVGEASWGCLRQLSATEFATILRALGVSVAPVYLDPKNVDQRGAFGTPPGVYRVRATGTAGAVTKTLDVIVTLDPKQGGGPPNDLGRILHWRED